MKLEYMDEFGLDYSIPTPGLNLNLDSVNHNQTAVEIAGAYNEWMDNAFYHASDQFKTVLLVAH